MPRAMPRTRESHVQPTKREIELARARADIAQANASVERWRYLGPAVQGATLICSCAVPLAVLRLVIDPLAGKTTIVNANIVISITVALSVAINVGQYVKSSSQRAEMKRMRERLDQLEGQSGQLP